MNDTTSTINHDSPVPTPPTDVVFGSDAIAGMLRSLDIPYIALNPGASYRGLHDSIVNYLGNRTPQMILCLHDEHAVSIAQGYFKASDRMMAAALHSNVGLMHATMPIFNSWCDRSPVLIIGATGAWDAAKRRPWIEWIHTCSDQAQLIRNYTKWDNQPGSVAATGEALLRAAQIAQTAPKGPVYVNLDVSIQEQALESLPPPPDVSRFPVPQPARPAPELVEQAARLLSEAKNPVMLAGRCSRSLEAWNARVALAEKLNIPVLTHIKLAAAFP
jgi:thiamine pyrophosphate-dependent acetolactate synthase large subunit-like protein